MNVQMNARTHYAPVRFGNEPPKPQTEKKPDAKTQNTTVKAPKSKTRKWIFRSMLGLTLLGGLGVGLHVRNAITVIHNTVMNPAVSGEAYGKQSGLAKRELLWQQVEASRYAALPDTTSAGVTGGSGVIGKFDNFVKIFDSAYMGNTFDQTGDVRPAHDKLFHPFGTVAKVKWVPKQGHPFTGMFEKEAVGLARLSLATNQQDFNPGLALKLMVDGQPSVSVIAVPSLDPQVSRDFFAQTASTRFPAPQGAAFKIINPILSKAGGVATSNELPVDHFAAMTPEGKGVTTPVAPYTLEFRPAQAHTDAKSTNDFRTDLAQIPAGTTLYEVWGKTADGKAYPVAEVVSQSPFVASKFGDQELLFRHQR